MAKSKKEIKIEQANAQEDATFSAGWGEGLTTGGVVQTATVDMADMGGPFSVDFGQLDLFSEEDLREKYPALRQAHEHYMSVLEVCKTKEKEDNEN